MEANRQEQNCTFDALPSEEQDLKFTVLEEKMQEILQIRSLNLDVLKTLGVIGADGKYNHAGELLADTNPFCGIDCTRFGETTNIILDHETFDHRSLLLQYAAAVALYRQYYQYDVIEGAFRKTVEKIPEKAFRAVIAHALVERAWDVDEPIGVAMYEDRIEVSSPGRLPGGLTEQQYLEGQAAVLRNPILASVFFSLHLIENVGSCIRRVREAYQDSAAKPVCSFPENVMTVTLPVIRSAKDLGEKEKVIYDCLDHVGKSSSEIARQAGFGKSKTLGILSDLVQRGYASKSGNGRGTKYRSRR